MPSTRPIIAITTLLAAAIAALLAAAALPAPVRAEPPAQRPSKPAAAEPAAAADAAKPRISSRTLAAQHTLIIRGSAAPVELGEQMSALIPRLIGFAMMQRLDMSGPPFARYRHYSEERIDFEVGVPIAAAHPGSASWNIEPGTLPAGPALTAVHRGSYDDLPDTHAALRRAARARGKRADGPLWEVFVTNPATQPDPAKLRTEVYLSLAP
ncbi:GyrI-like domain-containing protein [Haliangium ochraceum]|uniref:Transcriptional activator ligand binding domain protein n=1 Tax=Haliangium ochraceum (strain DSM 14365 / JCM 11303 / SMP-2) TaxID=502025 RepID=D0LHT0_HALO1|nr:GyrI-like domain-containing protein [Haliangium ochraceum]ACY14759.1 transcriptional activator ligand binding domain protein [Haliangium ochraceum DSM 14365]